MTQECTPQIRVDGALFSGAGYTERHATRFAIADEDSFAVFVAESVPRTEVDRIVRELSTPHE